MLLYLNSDASNKRKSFSCSTNQLKKVKSDSYEFDMINAMVRRACSKNSPTKRKIFSKNEVELEYEQLFTSKRSLSDLLHSIACSENKKTPINNICLHCKAYIDLYICLNSLFNDDTAMHICNYVELDILNKFYIHSYCCMMCYGRFKSRSDEECSQQYLCDDYGIYIDSI